MGRRLARRSPLLIRRRDAPPVLLGGRTIRLGLLELVAVIHEAHDLEGDGGGFQKRTEVGRGAYRLPVDRHHAIALAQLPTTRRRRALPDGRQHHRLAVVADTQPKAFEWISHQLHAQYLDGRIRVDETHSLVEGAHLGLRWSPPAKAAHKATREAARGRSGGGGLIEGQLGLPQRLVYRNAEGVRLCEGGVQLSLLRGLCALRRLRQGQLVAEHLVRPPSFALRPIGSIC